MNCNIIKDLIPLCIDGCCSQESDRAVQEHIDSCNECKKLFEDMKAPSDAVSVSAAPVKLTKLNDWKASALQSVSLFVSFTFITLGVYLEAGTPSGLTNGFWAFNLVIPATGFMLSLTNWYFIRFYKSRKLFSNCSMLITLGITVCAFIWSCFHYELNIFELFTGVEFSFAGIIDVMEAIPFLFGIGILLTSVLCGLSKMLSVKYAQMLGKE